jgi:hypothetical protein
MIRAYLCVFLEEPAAKWNVGKPIPRPIPCRRYKDNRGRAVRKRSGVSFFLANWLCNGACGKTSGRSIFRHAPLRATSSGLRRSIWWAILQTLARTHFENEKRVAFAPGGKLLLLLYRAPLFYPPIPTNSADFGCVRARKFGFQFKNSYRPDAQGPKRFLFRYNRIAPHRALSSVG